MIYGSVCSGIEAATVAWHPLGWSPAFFSEIEKFPSAVLAHHYGSNLPGEVLGSNGVPNLGDMTRYAEWPDYAIDLLVGGTPCQDYSLAGLRAGLDGERGNLMLVYAAIARRYRPKWLVWENVPGVLSSGAGRDFGSLLGLLSGQRINAPSTGWGTAGVVPGIASAYGLAWRVLDAQYVRVDGLGRAVPQRRRRVFVVGYLGDWRRAAAVLFERQGLCGDTPPRRQAGQNAAPTLAARTKGGGGLGTDFDCDGGLIHFQGRGTNLEFGKEVDGTLGTSIDRASGSAPCVAHTLTRGAESKGKGGYSGRRQEDDFNLVARCVTSSNQRIDWETETFVAHALRADGFDASEDGTGRGTPLVPVGVALRGREGGATAELTGEVMTSLRTGGGGGDKPHVLCPDDQASTSWRVRRLTPKECLRLQGFPDDHLSITFRGKPAADGPRYKATGNSMATNVMRWIGRRIQMVESIASK